MSLVARGVVILGLPGCVLMILAGCAGTEAPAQLVNREVITTPDSTEAWLLARLEDKFENPEVHYQLAHLYHKSQNWTKAERYYVQAISFDPGMKEAQAGLVKMFIDSGDKPKAEEFANAYIRQAALSVKETLRLGWEFEQLGLDDYALRSYKQAVAAAPDSYAANKQLGLYYLGKDDSANAKLYLMRSFQLNPRQPEVAGALGRLGVVVQTPGIPEGPLEEKTK
ncbi:MAG: tetratricopeptide repeat protein [Sedimentisphaerales bacterium]|nr:tetratricopeptide repeat protein [Sedimentisphaerales bacterium]